MNDETRKKWDTIYSNRDGYDAKAAYVLTANRHLLPTSGRALEVACGRGANALWLAELGLEVDAWDISPVVIEQLNGKAKQRQLAIHGQARDVLSRPPENAQYDVVVVSHFLERSLFPLLKAALKPGGLLCYQTFTQVCVSDSGPGNKEYRLAENELLTLCQDLQIIVYREEGRVGDLTQGLRDVALVIAQKRGK